jgi:hypothetical protein
MRSPLKLRSDAARFRRLAAGVSDRRTTDAINALAAEYEAAAASLSRWHATRERAYEMWEEQERPHGLHLDHWLSAEQELVDDERLEAGHDEDLALKRW